MIHNSCNDIRQSSLYASFMQSIGWNVEVIDNAYFYIKKFPFLPAVIKLQRPDKIPDVTKLRKLMHEYRAKSINIEPATGCQLSAVSCQLLNNAFLPTKTIYIDLTVSEEVIFNRFSEAKRRAVRRAEKNNVQVTVSDNIEEFIRLKNKTSGFLGFMTTKTLKPLWQTLGSKNATILLAKKRHAGDASEGSQTELHKVVPPELAGTMHEVWDTRAAGPVENKQPPHYLAGILLLHFNNIAYYWIAAATGEGKRLFAPTLLVWETLKYARKKGCTIFDFEGVFDERFPKTNREWLGFTRFKQGFGGKEIYFPKTFKITS